MISVVVRTLNEERYLGELLAAIRSQVIDLPVEIVLVDSGSTDSTIAIAKSHGCRVEVIDKRRFSFGRSLNLGCAAAKGEYLAFVSGHCIPTDGNWLRELVDPLRASTVDYAYGRQIGTADSRFSECQLFRKSYPERSRIPQEGFFCNNANAAVTRRAWERDKFDEALTGLEDMALAKQIVGLGGRVGYVAEACVYHIHDETWRAIRTRYEREAVALRGIMPQVHVTLLDFVRYFTSSVLLDFGAALQERRLMRNAFGIVAYRLMQYWGTYRGNHEHRKLSQAMKDRYFYPR
jgi:glycosyltransferase involved in cell wall biosynthesis